MMQEAPESRWLMITGGDVVLPDGQILEGGCVVVQEGRIFEILAEAPGSLLLEEGNVQIINAEGCWVTPGLIDQHMHGAFGIDYNQSSLDDIRGLLFQLPKEGITGVVPTLMTAPKLDMVVGLSTMEEVIHTQEINQARVFGIHLEGPFLNPEYKGAHPVADILPPTQENLEGLLSPSLKRITIAPEKDLGHQMIHLLSQQGILCSLGHSGADYQNAVAAFEAGANCLTHLYNAMPHLDHREPGLLAAGLLNDDVYVELIGDCIHVSPPVMQLTIKTKPFDKTILISDCTTLTGLPPGSTRQFGKQTVTVYTDGARNEDGKLAGSTLLLSDCIRHMVHYGVLTFPDAIQLATSNPAKYLGVANDYGQIAPDAIADLVVWRKQDLQIEHVFLAGEPVTDSANVPR